MRKHILKLGSMIAAMAFVVSYTASNQTCFIIANQPTLPNQVKSLRRF